MTNLCQLGVLSDIALTFDHIAAKAPCQALDLGGLQQYTSECQPTTGDSEANEGQLTAHPKQEVVSNGTQS